jgi:type IX secretion system PorP/SprF family membrane protein
MKKINRIIKRTIFLPIVLIFNICSSQDIHFSQFYSSPMNLNPALTGRFNGDYRFVANERRQWASVTIPYQTYGISADAKNPLGKENIGAGLSIYTDKAGDSDFGTLQVQLSGAYTFRFGADSLHNFTVGIQPGFLQRKINYNKLTFDNQYNGLRYDSSIDPNETFQRDNRNNFNINSGMVWQYIKNERKQISAGISLYNISKPKQSFFNDNVIKLDRRLNFYTTLHTKITEKLDIIPSFLFSNQGKFKEIIAGTNLKYILNAEPFKYRAVYLGGWMRAGDAGFAMLGMDYNNLHVGLSYDLNFSNLRPASAGKGGLEIAIIYIIRNILPQRVPHKICPDFI